MHVESGRDSCENIQIDWLDLSSVSVWRVDSGSLKSASLASLINYESVLSTAWDLSSGSELIVGIVRGLDGVELEDSSRVKLSSSNDLVNSIIVKIPACNHLLEISEWLGSVISDGSI